MKWQRCIRLLKFVTHAHTTSVIHMIYKHKYESIHMTHTHTHTHTHKSEGATWWQQLCRLLVFAGLFVKEPYTNRVLLQKRPSSVGCLHIVAAAYRNMLYSQVSFAKDPYQNRSLSQKRPSSLGCLLIVA